MARSELPNGEAFYVTGANGLSGRDARDELLWRAREERVVFSVACSDLVAPL